MEYNIQLSMRLDANALQTFIRTLDGGPHGRMRGIIDSVISQARQQEEAAKAQAAAAAPTDVDVSTGGTD